MPCLPLVICNKFLYFTHTLILSNRLIEIIKIIKQNCTQKLNIINISYYFYQIFIGIQRTVAHILFKKNVN